MVYSNARLFSDCFEVGKIYYFSNNIKDILLPNNNKYFDNVVIELYNNKCFESDTFLSGQLFYTVSSNIFDLNKQYPFESISTGGSFTDKEIYTTITTDETPIRKVKLHMKNIN